MARIAALQREAGDLAADAAPGAPAGVPGTLRALGALDDLRALGSPPVQAACAYLAGAQAVDGSWGEPGDDGDERLFATAMLGGYLAKTRFARPALIEAAGDYLSARWAPARVKGGDWRALTAHAHYFANVDHERSDEVLQWCGRELERGFRSGALPAVGAARVLVTADAGAMPGARLEAAELVAGVLREQAEDGGWGEPDGGAPARVEQTLDALAALARLA